MNIRPKNTARRTAKNTAEYTKTSFNKPVEGMISAAFMKLFSSSNDPVLIAVGGPGGVGKSAFSRKLAAKLTDSAVLKLDDYKTPRQFRKDKGIYGAHPDANEMEMISEHLAMLKSGLSIDKPVYNSGIGRSDSTEKFIPAKFNIIDGEVATYEEFSDFIDINIFIDAALSTQLATRLTRDTGVREYTKEKAMATFLGSNVSEFRKYGAYTKELAEIILFCHKDYTLTIDDIALPLKEYLPDFHLYESTLLD